MKVKLNPAFYQMRGHLRDMVFRRYFDQTIAGAMPNTEGYVPTPAQQLQRVRFGEATAYAHQALADPAIRALYQAKAKKLQKTAVSVAVADYFHSPVVSELDLENYHGAINDPIRVEVRDDFGVIRVIIEVRQNGVLLETGNAVETPAGSGVWMHAAQTALTPGTTVQVAAFAFDRPGGFGQEQAVKTV